MEAWVFGCVDATPQTPALPGRACRTLKTLTPSLCCLLPCPYRTFQAYLKLPSVSSSLTPGEHKDILFSFCKGTQEGPV